MLNKNQHKRYIKNSKGQGFVEFAVTAAILFALVLGIAEWWHVSQTWLALQHSVNEGARKGSVLSTNGSTRTNDIKQIVINEAARMGLTLTPAQIDFPAFSDTAVPGGPGSADTYFRLRATTTINLFSGSFRLLANPLTSFSLRAETLIQNEPYA